MSAKRKKGEGSSSKSVKQYDRTKFINMEAAEKFEAWESRALIPERGLRPDPFKDGEMAAMIAKRGWFAFAEQPIDAVVPIVKEFYANLQPDDYEEVRVRGRSVERISTEINKFYGLPDYDITEGYGRFVRSEPDYEKIISELCKPGTKWRIRGGGTMTFPHSELSRYGKAWYAFICAKLMPTLHISDVSKDRAMLLYCLVTEKKINVGDVIEQSILRAVNPNTTGGFPHPSLICALCYKAGVRWNAKEEVVSSLSVIDHSLIKRYKVWEGGESHPMGLGYIVVQPPPGRIDDEPTTSNSTMLQKLHKRVVRIENKVDQTCRDLDRHLGRIAERQDAMHNYNTDFNTALLQMFVQLNPSIAQAPCPLPAVLPTYPPSDKDDSSSSEEEEEEDDADA